MTTRTFTGQGQIGSWGAVQNWAGHILPGATDLALLDGAAPQTFAGPISVGTIMLLGNSNVAFQGTVNTADAGFCRGIMVCEGATMTFDAGSTLNDLAGSLNIGVDAAGSFIADGTAGRPTVINTADALVGQYAPAVGSITIDDATWNASGTALIGGAGTGSVDVRDGGVINIAGNLAVAGSATTSVGNVTIEAGSTINVLGTLGLGQPQANQMSGGVGTVTVDAGGILNVGHWLLEGATSSLVLNGGTVNLGTSGQGWISVHGGSISGYGTLTSESNLLGNDGTITAQGGTLEIKSTVNEAGVIDIGANSTAKLDGSVVQGSVIGFTGANGSLEFLGTPLVTAQINGFGAGDKIVFDSEIDSVKWLPSTGWLDLSSGGHLVDKLHLGGMAANAAFDLQHAIGSTIIMLHNG